MSKKILTIIYTILLLFPLTSKTFAATPEYSITPTTGYVAVNNNFAFDIHIDSAGNELTLARIVITYDPSMAQVVKAEKNAAIFCQWPSDEQSVDNTNGVVMMTAFCQTGASALYKTEGSADVIGRITFKALKTGKIEFDWEYNGRDEPFKTVMMTNGSPPQNVLSAKPDSITITAVAGVSGTSTPAPTKYVPNTGIHDTKYYNAGIITLGASLSVVLLCTLALFFSRKNIIAKFKTIMVYKKNGE